MDEEILALKKNFNDDVGKARTVKDIQELEVKYLGKKGPVQDLMKLLKNVPAHERPSLGKLINDVKVEFSERLSSSYQGFLYQEESQKLEKEKIDITLPGRRHYPGKSHLLISSLYKVIDIFAEMGFSVQYGPEIETDYYNFEALNFAPDHPARDMQDTFYISPNILLRTHTSNIQTRFMETHKPPIRIIAPGKAFRNETVSARSHVFFHQVEGLYIDRSATFGDLFATIEEFAQKLFQKDVELRFRPSYFPFVEPGMEVDVSCLVCGGSGCSLCKHTGWLEIAGAGMVHPEVLKNGGVDPEEFNGYAWGMGIERLVLLKYGIKDIRLFTENDLRFLNQFVGI